MRMNVFEMEGFLRGRCVPRDLKVNETDAEYLVRKFDALEAKCAAQENKVIPVSTERKRKLTAVCSHQTRIGNLDAHLI